MSCPSFCPYQIFLCCCTLRSEGSVGQHKALSAAGACAQLNSSIKLETHLEGFTPANAVQLVSQYDVVVDASDNAPTRYLIR